MGLYQALCGQIRQDSVPRVSAPAKGMCYVEPTIPEPELSGPSRVAIWRSLRWIGVS